jgi:sugar lactone lactonase YvrE
MYIADAGSVRIYKVDTTGILTTLVGTGEAGYSGDGGPAKAAALSAPISLAVGPDGSIFIAADAHDRIRKIGSDGIIQTMAGTGEHVFGGDGGPAIAASLKGPSDIAIDRRGNLFVADTFNHRIREIDTRGLIRTVAGNGTTEGNADIDGRGANKVSLNAPESIAVDDDGNLFIADSGNGRICRVDREGIITTVAGRGNRSKGYNDESSQAISAVVNNPFAVAADHEGNIYIADYGPGFPEATKTRVRKIDRSGIIRTVFSDTGTAGE